MTDQKPCLPECATYPMGSTHTHHDPACQNAKPATEAAKVKRQRACRCVAGFEGYCPQHGSSVPFLDPRVRRDPVTVKVYPAAGPAPAEKGKVDFECDTCGLKSDDLAIVGELRAERDALAAEVERLETLLLGVYQVTGHTHDWRCDAGCALSAAQWAGAAIEIRRARLKGESHD